MTFLELLVLLSIATSILGALLGLRLGGVTWGCGGALVPVLVWSGLGVLGELEVRIRRWRARPRIPKVRVISAGWRR